MGRKREADEIVLVNKMKSKILVINVKEHVTSKKECKETECHFLKSVPIRNHIHLHYVDGTTFRIALKQNKIILEGI